jgi:hypothetical protein
MSKYLVRVVTSSYIDFEIEATNEKEARNKVELGHEGSIFRRDTMKTVYKVLTPDDEHGV